MPNHTRSTAETSRSTNRDRDLPETCVVCGKPTQSHPVPNGWLCHTCLTNRPNGEIFDALPVAPVPSLDPDTPLPCHWCEHEHTPRAVDTPGVNFMTVICGTTPFDALDAILILSCPRCAETTEYLTSSSAALDLVAALDLTAVRSRP